MNNAEFWREVVRTHEVIFRQFARDIGTSYGEYKQGKRDAYLEVAECLAFVLEDNKELAS